jgi:hypothetical protein
VLEVKLDEVNMLEGVNIGLERYNSAYKGDNPAWARDPSLAQPEYGADGSPAGTLKSGPAGIE